MPQLIDVLIYFECTVLGAPSFESRAGCEDKRADSGAVNLCHARVEGGWMWLEIGTDDPTGQVKDV